MKTQEVRGPIGLFSDAHGNTEAFRIAHSALQRAGARDIWYLGDLVGYVPDATIVAEARSLPINCLSGNHESMMLSARQPAPHEADYRHGEMRRALDKTDIAFLEGLKPSAELKARGKRILLVHGSPTDPVNGYVYPDTDLTPFGETDTEIVFAGHTHRPMDRFFAGIRFVNVGSCGLPRDGSGLGSACLYDADRDHLEFLKFDISDTCRALIARFELSEAVLKHYRTAMAHKPAKVQK